MLQVPGFWLTFLYYFSVTNLIVILVVSQGMEIGFHDRILYQIAVFLGLIAGLVGAKFNRSVTISASFSNKKTFSKILNETLYQMGFEPKSHLEDFTLYKNRPGKVYLQAKFLFVSKINRRRLSDVLVLLKN